MTMTINQFLNEALTKLKSSSSPRLDSLLMLETTTDKDRAWILAHQDAALSQLQQLALQQMLARRLRHEPMAYIIGQAEFYGRSFYVDNRVLVPRPESETLIEMLQLIDLGLEPVIVDVGTGSGALGITAALELPVSHVKLVDIDKGCLAVAKQNAARHKANVEIILSNLLDGLHGQKIDVLLCNLPYVPDDFTVNSAAKHEPELAIYGGQNGLDLYRKLFSQIAGGANPRYVLTESLPTQHHKLAIIARDHGYEQTRQDDFIQLFEPA